MQVGLEACLLQRVKFLLLMLGYCLSSHKVPVKN
jgi:hypothetical protein